MGFRRADLGGDLQYNDNRYLRRDTDSTQTVQGGVDFGVGFIYPNGDTSGHVLTNVGDGIAAWEPNAALGNRNVDGGNAASKYLPSQVIDGGGASG